MKKMNIRLDNSEKKIERAISKREYIRVSDLNETEKLFKEAVENYQELSKTKRITIRVNNQDLIKVKSKAKRNNIPYQTLLNTLIRQFAEGKVLVQF